MDADKRKRRLSKKLRSFSVVLKGELDTRGDDFNSVLKDHDPFVEFLREKNEYPPASLRPPGNLHENFSELKDGKKKRLIMQTGIEKIRYREKLRAEYKQVCGIEHLSDLLNIGGQNFAKGMRNDFLHYTSPRKQPQREPTIAWHSLEPIEVEAAVKLRQVLNELVEVTCCGPELAELYEGCDEKVALTSKHASRALTPYLPLCSDGQLALLVKVLGRTEGANEDAANFAREMFSAYDYSFECPWIWDIILETIAHCTRSGEHPITEKLESILGQCEPWGGQMHEEEALACAAALAFDNFGRMRILVENAVTEEHEDDTKCRASQNGEVFCELLRLQASQADNLVAKAMDQDCIDLFNAGGYLEWIEALKLPASNQERIKIATACAEKTCDLEYAHKILPKQREKVQKWRQETERWSDRPAVANEALAAGQRLAFDHAVKELLKLQRITAGDIRKELANYQQVCKKIEDRYKQGQNRVANGNEASTSKIPAPSRKSRKQPRSEKVCDHCEKPPPEGAKLKKCSECRPAQYCGAECQKLAWKAGHKEYCQSGGLVRVAALY